MAKKAKPVQRTAIGMPNAPWIYISDPNWDSKRIKELKKLIPDASVKTHYSDDRLRETLHGIRPKKETGLLIFADKKSDKQNTHKITTAKIIKEAAIVKGCNFASVNIMENTFSVNGKYLVGVNHTNFVDGRDVAERIYKWLFTVLTIRETLYLIPEEQMKAIDTKYYPEYEYCAVADTRKKPNDAKIQFVVLILTKPQVVAGKRITWSVCDRTGVTNFYFQYRGPSSQFTWDWALALTPGDRKTLPRMPSVEVREKKHVTVAKAPFRAAGAVVGGAGFVVKSIGKGLCNMGRGLKMGERKTWVPEADVGADGKRIDWSKTDASAADSAGKKKKGGGMEKTIRVFNENGEKAWSDGASVADTDIASTCDEKNEKDFM